MNRKSFFLLLIFSMVVLAVSAQHLFSGTIKYKVTYPANASSPIIASLPSSIDMQISGNKAKFELSLPNGKQTIIINGDESSVTRLIDLKEGKFYIKKTKEELGQGPVPVTVPLKESRTIAGFNCKGAEVTSTDKGGKTDKGNFYYSEELGANNIYFNTSAKGIKGILLDFEYTISGVIMQMSAQEVNPSKISGRTFDIPSDYQETTEAKIQQMRQAKKKK